MIQSETTIIGKVFTLVLLLLKTAYSELSSKKPFESYSIGNFDQINYNFD